MKTIINSPLVPQPIGPYNQAVLIDNGGLRTLYTSGQIAIDPATGELKIDDLEEETQLVMQHLQHLLEEVGMTFDHVIKTSIFLSNMHHFDRVNKVYASFFNEENAPARETVEVASLPKFVNVEISLIAIS